MRPCRIVLDSNIIVSAFLFGGVPRRVMDLILEGKVECFVSVAILDEVRDVLQRPKFGLLPEHALAFAEAFHDICQMVSPAMKIHAIKDDPDDNMVLECASAAAAGFIVSGDKHLLALGEWEGIQVVNATDFLRNITGQ